MDIDMIKKLIELDKKACKYMDSVESVNAESAKSLDDDKINLYKNYMQRAENRIKKARAMAIELENEKRKLCQEKFVEMSDIIAKNYEDHKEVWVNELFQKCIE